MINKRAQLSIFVIMVIVITVGALFIFFLGKEEASKVTSAGVQKELAADDINLRNFVENCVEVIGKESLFYLGFVGGRLKPDPFAFYYYFDDNYKIPYLYIEGRNDIPLPYEEKYWTNLLDRYIHNNFETCINNFESFKGAKIDFGKAVSKTEFTDTSVIFNVNFPVTVNRDFKVVNLDQKYTDEINVRLRDILKTTTTIVEKEVKDDKFIHWDYLTEVGNNGYNITAYTEEDNTIIYRIIDLENNIDNEFYIFQFANKIKVPYDEMPNPIPLGGSSSIPSPNQGVVSQTYQLITAENEQLALQSSKKTPRQSAWEYNAAVRASSYQIHGDHKYISAKDYTRNPPITCAEEEGWIDNDYHDNDEHWVACGSAIQCATSASLPYRPSDFFYSCSTHLNLIDTRYNLVFSLNGNKGVVYKSDKLVNIDDIGSTTISVGGDGAFINVIEGINLFLGSGIHIYDSMGLGANGIFQTDSFFWKVNSIIAFADTIDTEEKLAISFNRYSLPNYENSADFANLAEGYQLLARGFGNFFLLTEENFFPLFIRDSFKGDSSIVYNKGVILNGDYIVRDPIYDYTIKSDKDSTVVIARNGKIIQDSLGLKLDLTPRQRSLVYEII